LEKDCLHDSTSLAAYPTESKLLSISPTGSSL
jgi:hypothetical protein